MGFQMFFASEVGAVGVVALPPFVRMVALKPPRARGLGSCGNSMICLLTAWPEEEVLGLSIDYSDDWICWPASNILFKTHVCHDRF